MIGRGKKVLLSKKKKWFSYMRLYWTSRLAEAIRVKFLGNTGIEPDPLEIDTVPTTTLKYTHYYSDRYLLGYSSLFLIQLVILYNIAQGLPQTALRVMCARSKFLRNLRMKVQTRKILTRKKFCWKIYFYADCTIIDTLIESNRAVSNITSLRHYYSIMAVT